MTDLRVPNVSISMQEVQVLRWLVDDGAPVRPGQPLVEIETDKATVEVEAPAAGRLQVVAAAGATVAADGVLARIVAEHESLETQSPTPRADDVAATTAPAPDPPHPQPATRSHSSASPAARRLARERAVDLSGVAGSGPGGRVVVEDVERAAAFASRRTEP